MFNFIPLARSGVTEKRGRAVLVTVLVAAVALCGLYMYSTAAELRGQALVQLLNNQQLSWTAGMNNASGGGGPGWAGEVLTAQRASRREDKVFRLPSVSLLNTPDIPTAFDFRDQHPSCQDIEDAQQPSGCSPSWVDIVASAASERLCVASGTSVRVRLWAREVAACCTRCLGPLHAWFYLNVRGFPETHHKECPPEAAVTSCGITALSRRFSELLPANYTSQVRHYGTSAYLLPQSVESIQLEMMKSGPVVALLDVYSDFYYYRTGVYQYKYGSYQGSTAVKMIGWGRQSGLDYWLAVTSWSHHWGDRGIFKIRRGTNECKVEDDVTAGHMLPR